MQRPPVPGSVTLGRILLIIESVLWLVGGIAIGGYGVLVLADASDINNRLQQIGYSGSPITTAEATAVGGTLVVFGVIILMIAILGIWSGAAVGRLSSGPRVTGIVLACLGLVIGILAALGGFHTRVHTSALSGTPIPGIVLVVVNLLIIWTLGLSSTGRAAFRSLPPAAYPMTAPAGYGPAPSFGQAAVPASFPDPPPPPPPPAPVDVPPPPPPPPPPPDE
jgi:hypothetical protein